MDAHITCVANSFSSFANVLGQVITPGNNFHVVIMHHEILLFLLIKSSALQLHDTCPIFALKKKGYCSFSILFIIFKMFAMMPST